MLIRLIKKQDILKATKLYGNIWPEDKFSRVKKYFQGKVKSKEGFVAIENNKIVGILGFTKRYFKDSDYLDEVIVDKKYRKKGIASALVKKLELNAKKRKSRRIFSSTESKNKISLKFHKKLGYKKVGYVDHMWKENKKEIIFSKRLR